MTWVYFLGAYQVIFLQSLIFHYQGFSVSTSPLSNGTPTNSSNHDFYWKHSLLSKKRSSSSISIPTTSIITSWMINHPDRNKKRIKRNDPGNSLETIPRRLRDNSWAFGMGYSSTALAQFRQEQEKYRIQNGGFMPPSACPENRPYIFYCDPRQRKGPINPATGQPWPNGIFFLPSKAPSITSTSTTTTTITPRRLSLRPPCDSILCPVGGNEGYGYTGLEDNVSRQIKQPKSHLHYSRKNCSSLLCIFSAR